jgi:hypothetical protein
VELELCVREKWRCWAFFGGYIVYVGDLKYLLSLAAAIFPAFLRQRDIENSEKVDKFVLA